MVTPLSGASGPSIITKKPSMLSKFRNHPREFIVECWHKREALRYGGPALEQLRLLSCFLLVFGLLQNASWAGYVRTNIAPPSIQREFRGAWVSTLNNIDWPSKPGLPVDEQKRELLRILDRAVERS